MNEDRVLTISPNAVSTQLEYFSILSLVTNAFTVIFKAVQMHVFSIK